MTDKTNELKNCPFCGSADVTVDIFDGVNDDWKAKWNPEYVTELGDDFVIMCDKCGFTTGEYAEPEHIIERWNRRYDHAAAELRWIPVSERLPDKNYEWYLCTFDAPDYGGWQVSEFQWRDGHWHTVGAIPYPQEIIAWMPLPKPYTEPADNIAEVGEMEGVDGL